VERGEVTAPATIWGLGVGPGDPGLVTIRAAEIARRATVLAYPAPERGESLARAIMAPHLPGGQEEIAIRMPLDAGRYPAEAAYDDAAARLLARAEAGREVAVLCLGDPFFYGSFMYLFARLAARARVEVVPGVTSVSAAAAIARFPLAARADAFAVVPALLPDAEIERRLAAAEGAAILKLGRHFGRVKALLARLGLAADARYVERAGLDGERAAPLAAVELAEAPYFSLILLHRRGAAWR
jgi:precorrin-2/cobalt-factor-2 C20-methyltransferase